ncbi:MAG: ABC transporter permease [Actinobacteria bacterium]|nr:ABC transporter permease [Actinomycetota bacterium]
MPVYVVKRVLAAAVLGLALTLVTFIIFYVIPTNQVQVRGGGFTDLGRATQVSGPIFEQYGRFLWNVAHGSLGNSFFSRRSVNEIMLDAAPVTISLTIGGAIMWMLIALPFGIFSAMRPRSAIDRSATILVLIGLSVHPLWLGLMLSYIFGFRLHLLPEGGYCDMINPDTACGGPVQWFSHLLLPWFTFALVFAALYVRMIRASVAEALHEDYVRSGRAKGLSEWGAVRVHVLPNAILPVFAMLAMDIGRFALPTALFVETAFGLPGLGKVLYESLQRNDLPVLVGVVVFTVLGIALLNLVAELLYAVFDPRVKLSTAGIRL